MHRAGRTGRAGNTGTAVTFLTEEQDRYSVDIAKALRQSGQPVPDGVQKLVDQFMEKVKSGKRKQQQAASGAKASINSTRNEKRNELENESHTRPVTNQTRKKRKKRRRTFPKISS